MNMEGPNSMKVLTETKTFLVLAFVVCLLAGVPAHAQLPFGAWIGQTASASAAGGIADNVQYCTTVGSNGFCEDYAQVCTAPCYMSNPLSASSKGEVGDSTNTANTATGATVMLGTLEAFSNSSAGEVGTGGEAGADSVTSVGWSDTLTITSSTFPKGTPVTLQFTGTLAATVMPDPVLDPIALVATVGTQNGNLVTLAIDSNYDTVDTQQPILQANVGDSVYVTATLYVRTLAGVGGEPESLSAYITGAENPDYPSDNAYWRINIDPVTCDVGYTTASGVTYTTSERGPKRNAKTCTTAVPVNFQQSGPGIDLPDGFLKFQYTWASSSGNLEDLAQCEIGEYVTYPGASPFPWPSPPYKGSTKNPSVSFAEATLGVTEDTQKHEAFLEPYVANAFNATQAFWYRCRPGVIVEIPGWTGITIARTVADSTGDGCWGYTVTKSGYSAPYSPLPGVNKKACESEASHDVPLRVPDFKNSSDEIGLSVSPPKSSVSLNAPVFLDLTVLNRSAETVGADLGLNSKANLELTITEPGGGVITRRLSSEGFGASGEVSLAPKETFVERLLLNEWYDFPLTGTYRIKIALLDDSGTNDSASAGRPSTDFTVQINPRDPAELEDVCQELANKAISGATLEESMDAASALSYIRDPLAIDSLIRVLQHGSLVEHYAVDGLGRIGSPKAIAALEAAQNHPDEEVRAAARYMLEVLHGQAQGASGPVD